MPKLICNMQALARAIAAVLPAASRDKDRLDVCGVNLHSDGTDIIATATDGNVTARYKIELPEQADPDFRIMVPRNRALQLLAIVGNEQGECQVVRDESLFRATFEQVGSFQFIVNGTEVPFPLATVDGQWPTGLPVSNRDLDLDPALASRVKKAFAAAGADGALRFELYGPDAAIVVRHESVPQLEALILPHTADEDEGGQAALFGSDTEGDGGSGETAEDRAAEIEDDPPDTDPPSFIQSAEGNVGEPADPPSIIGSVGKTPVRAVDAHTVAPVKPHRTPMRPNKTRKPSKKPAKKGNRK
jgi:hypothetical protein